MTINLFSPVNYVRGEPLPSRPCIYIIVHFSHVVKYFCEIFFAESFRRHNNHKNQTVIICNRSVIESAGKMLYNREARTREANHTAAVQSSPQIKGVIAMAAAELIIAGISALCNVIRLIRDIVKDSKKD